ncbi:peptidoglycan editing factor PgeF [Sphingomonas daechungensis]|uniref:peptidoglycan editing factor PgeF n=1 Tax=Sphingomonas daechungensis TaxID=1176646 RepID=UPI003783B6CD
MSVEPFRSELLAGIPHGFLGRQGGVSGGEMWGLNVGYGSGDDPGHIAENRRRAIEAVFPSAALATVHQVHSPTVVYAAEPWPQDERPHADAMVTDRPGLLLGVLTADCAPVLFADEAAGVVAAAHSGWRGAFGGVNEATIDAMESLGASRDRIVAAIGPTIAQSSYEVDEAFRERLAKVDDENARFFVAGPGGKPHFDLPGYILHRLSRTGIARSEALALDTYGDPERFYSYRRSTHRNEPSYGRQIALIGLPTKS